MLIGLACGPHESRLLAGLLTTGGLDLPGLRREGESGTAGGCGALTGGAVSSSVSDSGEMYGSSVSWCFSSGGDGGRRPPWVAPAEVELVREWWPPRDARGTRWRRSSWESGGVSIMADEAITVVRCVRSCAWGGDGS